MTGGPRRLSFRPDVLIGTGHTGSWEVESICQRDGRMVAYPVGETRYRYEESPSSATQGSG